LIGIWAVPAVHFEIGKQLKELDIGALRILAGASQRDAF
jgi:hypothetical protein